jgi:hypothetical protein
MGLLGRDLDIGQGANYADSLLDVVLSFHILHLIDSDSIPV